MPSVSLPTAVRGIDSLPMPTLIARLNSVERQGEFVDDGSAAIVIVIIASKAIRRSVVAIMSGE